MKKIFKIPVILGISLVLIGSYSSNAAQQAPSTEFASAFTESKQSSEPLSADELKELISRADNGSAREQYDLADIYVKGRGVPKSDEEAATWLRKSRSRVGSRR